MNKHMSQMWSCILACILAIASTIGYIVNILFLIGYTTCMFTPNPRNSWQTNKDAREARIHKMHVNQLVLKMHIEKSTTTKHFFRNFQREGLKKYHLVVYYSFEMIEHCSILQLYHIIEHGNINIKIIILYWFKPNRMMLELVDQQNSEMHISR